MPSTQAVRHQSDLVRNNPAVEKAGWLPAGLWQELDEARTRHDEAVGAVNEARDEAAALGKKFEQEDKARIAAYKDGLTTPEMTDPAAREASVANARAKVEGAEGALAEAAAEALRLVQEKEGEWLRDLNRRAAEAEAKQEEAKRLVEEARQMVGEVTRTRRWIQRTALDTEGKGHIAHDDLGVPMPPEDPAWASIGGPIIRA